MSLVAFPQVASVPRGENLVADGIPPIPASVKTAVDPYGNRRAADFLSWHPVRREMLVATSFGDVSQVHAVTAPGGMRRQLTFFADRPTGGVSYQPTHGAYFIFQKDSGGNQQYQNYRFDFRTGKHTLLTDGRTRNSAGVWDSKGTRIAYTSMRRTGRDADLYVVDPLHPATDRKVADLEGAGWTPYDWSPDDRRILMRQAISVNETYLWLVDALSGERTLITPAVDTATTAYFDVRFAHDSTTLYVTTDRGSEFRRLARYDFRNRRYRFLTTAIPWDVYDYDVSPDGKLIAVVANENGFLTLYLLDASTGRELAIPGLKSRLSNATSVAWHRDGKVLGLNLDSGRRTTDAYALDVATGKLEQWTFSESAIDTRDFQEAELLRWRSFDGLDLSAALYRPPTRFTGKRPVVIDVHGGPDDQFQPHFLGRQNYLLNELGVVLLFPNIRGSSGYGKSFLKLDDGLLRENAYRDIGSLLDWIKARPDLDADRVMITGFSYGGNVALVAAYRYADRIRCVIDVVGPSNLVTFLETTAEYRRDLRRVEYGDERDPVLRAFLERTAPLNNAAGITKPLFVVQGANDPAVPTTEAEQIVKAVRARGTPVWYLLAKDEGHGYYNRTNSAYLFYATVEFMKTYLLN